MKKYYISRVLDFVMVFILIWFFLIIGVIVVLDFSQNGFKIIDFIIFLFIFLFYVASILFIVIKYCFHYVYIKDDTIFYKTIYNEKKIYLLDENLEFLKKREDIIAVRPCIEDIIVLKSNSIEIKIPLYIYNEIKKEYSQLPDV